MSNEQWAVLRKRLYNALPYIPLLLVAYGVTSENMAVLWTSLVAQLIGPAIGHTAAHYVSVMDAKWLDKVNTDEYWEAEPNVSRETFTPEIQPDVSRETITAPCVVMHGTAEPHVLGCDGWSFDQG